MHLVLYSGSLSPSLKTGSFRCSTPMTWFNHSDFKSSENLRFKPWNSPLYCSSSVLAFTACPNPCHWNSQSSRYVGKRLFLFRIMVVFGKEGFAHPFWIIYLQNFYASSPQWIPSFKVLNVGLSRFMPLCYFIDGLMFYHGKQYQSLGKNTTVKDEVWTKKNIHMR